MILSYFSLRVVEWPRGTDPYKLQTSFGTVYKKAPILRIILLDTKLPQQAGNVVTIYYVVFLSEIWQKFNMAFFIGYESSRVK